MRGCSIVGFSPLLITGAGILGVALGLPLAAVRSKSSPPAKQESKPLAEEESHYERLKILGIPLMETYRVDRHTPPPRASAPSAPAVAPRPTETTGPTSITPLIEVTLSPEMKAKMKSAAELPNACGGELNARLVPVYRDGKGLGLKVSAIRPDSIYAEAGLKDDDIIRRANGYPLVGDSPADYPRVALDSWGHIKDASRIYWEVERKGRVLNFTYAVPHP